MFKKFVLAFAILALAAAFAGTIPSARSYQITLTQAAVVNGTELQPGEYRLSFSDSKITLVKGKVNVESPAKVEAVERKFDNTAIRFVGNIVAEIRLGGTKTKIILNQ